MITFTFSFFFFRLHRQPKHVFAFLLAELGTSGSIDGNNHLIIKGRFQQKQIESVLKRYISKRRVKSAREGLKLSCISKRRLKLSCISKRRVRLSCISKRRVKIVTCNYPCCICYSNHYLKL